MSYEQEIQSKCLESDFLVEVKGSVLVDNKFGFPTLETSDQGVYAMYKVAWDLGTPEFFTLMTESTTSSHPDAYVSITTLSEASSVQEVLSNTRRWFIEDGFLYYSCEQESEGLVQALFTFRFTTLPNTMLPEDPTDADSDLVKWEKTVTVSPSITKSAENSLFGFIPSIANSLSFTYCNYSFYKFLCALSTNNRDIKIWHSASNQDSYSADNTALVETARGSDVRFTTSQVTFLFTGAESFVDETYSPVHVGSDSNFVDSAVDDSVDGYANRDTQGIHRTIARPLVAERIDIFLGPPENDPFQYYYKPSHVQWTGSNHVATTITSAGPVIVTGTTYVDESGTVQTGADIREQSLTLPSVDGLLVGDGVLIDLGSVHSTGTTLADAQAMFTMFPFLDFPAGRSPWPATAANPGSGYPAANRNGFVIKSIDRGANTIVVRHNALNNANEIVAAGERLFRSPIRQAYIEIPEAINQYRQNVDGGETLGDFFRLYPNAMSMVRDSNEYIEIVISQATDSSGIGPHAMFAWPFNSQSRNGTEKIAVVVDNTRQITASGTDLGSIDDDSGAYLNPIGQIYDIITTNSTLGSSDIDEDSFITEANNFSEIFTSTAVPFNESDKRYPSILDVLNPLLRSVFCFLFFDKNFKLKIISFQDIQNKTPDFVIDTCDIFEGRSYSSSFRDTYGSHSFEYNLGDWTFFGQQSNTSGDNQIVGQPYEGSIGGKASLFTRKTNVLSDSLSIMTTDVVGTDAYVERAKKAYFHRKQILKITVPVKYMQIEIGDIVEIQAPQTPGESYDGELKSKKYMVVRFQKTRTNVQLSLDDLAGWREYSGDL